MAVATCFNQGLIISAKGQVDIFYTHWVSVTSLYSCYSAFYGLQLEKLASSVEIELFLVSLILPKGQVGQSRRVFAVTPRREEVRRQNTNDLRRSVVHLLTFSQKSFLWGLEIAAGANF